MTPQFQYLIDWDNDTVFTGSLDDISSEVVDAEWFLGMRKAYQDCADESTLRLRVLNTGGKYNPENSAGTLYGKLKPRRRAMVRVTGYENSPLMQNLVSYWKLDEGSGEITDLTNGLVSYWKLDETSGTRNDSKGSNHLTDNNTVGYSASGKQGNAADFVRANSEYLSIADNTDLSTGDIDFTFAAWVKFDSEAMSVNAAILSKWTVSGNNREYILWKNAANYLSFSVSATGANTTTLTGTSLGTVSAGVWYFVVGYHDSVNNEIGISVNAGTPQVSAYSSGVYDGASVFVLGRYDTSNYMDGLIDEVAFWKRTLTSDERTWLYNSGNGRTYAEIAATAGVTRYDSKGSNHLTDTNTVGYTTGKQGNAASFTRADTDRLVCADNSTLSPGDSDFSFACWVRLDNKTNTQRILGKWDSPNMEFLLFYDASTDRFEFSVSTNGTTFAATATANNFGSPSTATWYFIVCYHDSVNNLIGISVNAGTFNTTSHSGGVYDGVGTFALSGTAGGLDGDMDEVGYWSEVLSGSQVCYLYNAGSGRAYTDLQIINLWTGWVSKIEVPWTPAGSYTGKTFATIQCIGMKDQLQDTEIDLSLQVDKTGDEIIHEILRTVGFPPSTSGIWTVGVSTVGGTDVIGNTSDIQSLETGTVTFDYYGTNQEKTDGWQAVIDITAAERGRFYFDRDGKAYWWNRSHVENLGADDGTIDESGSLGSQPVAVDYDYGDLLCNQVRVTAHPPRLDSESTTLFQLDSPVSIPPLTTVEIEALLTGRNGKRAATLAAALENGTFTSGTAEVAMKLFGEKAILRVTNSHPSTTAVLETQDIGGQELSVQNKMMATAEDATSIATYGKQQELRLNLRALADFDDAQAIADWELARRKDPVGHIASVSFVNKNDGTQNAFQLTRTIGDRVRIKLDGLGHDGDHLLIGERHAVREGGQVHETTFYFEPVYAGS